MKSESELMRRKLEGNQRTQSQSDQMVRELQSRESDLMEALQAKDSQLGVLRIRLEEADKQIESKQKSIASLEDDRSRSVRDKEYLSTELGWEQYIYRAFKNFCLYTKKLWR